METLPTSKPNSLRPARRASVLLVVLVVIVLLSLGAYTFSELMIVEAETTNLYGRTAQTRAFADSGIDYVVTLLDNRTQTTPLQTYNNPEAFQDILVQSGEHPRSTGRFTIIAPSETDSQRQSVRFGLIDESGKLNVNALSRYDGSIATTMLLALPEMTQEIAESILDWTDKNDKVRDYGAEDEYYLSLATPYTAKNGPVESLDELLLVRDLTPWLLYGEDANRNGLLDPGEDDGEASMPLDNADGVLDAGLSAYLTIDSRETNLRSDGSPRINIASDKLDELYDSLKKEFDEETAKFVVAYRLFGPKTQGNPSGQGGSPSKSSSPAVSTGKQGGSNAAQTGSRPTQSASTGENTAKNGDDVKTSAVKAGKTLFGGKGKVTRGDMDLSGGSKFPVKSVFDLVGVEVNAKIKTKQTTLKSPWAEDSSEMSEYLPELDDIVTALSEDNLSGRININQAPREVIRGLPEMTDELAAGIVSSRSTGFDGESLDDQSGSRDTVGWLLIEGLTDLETLRKLAPYITTGGDVYRVQILGYFDSGLPMTRIEALIDTTEGSPLVKSVRDLTPLGIGYPRNLFSTSQE